ncbi:hypothetical protein BD769DRAFT_1393633 [Suillus cothurnatus]|nr:hypothetical protein BD769DRAFT_1393633 [Suillus cothurnatus]
MACNLRPGGILFLVPWFKHRLHAFRSATTATRLKTAIQIVMSVKAILVSSLKRPCDGDQECDLDRDYLDRERDFYCDYQYGDAEPLLAKSLNKKEVIEVIVDNHQTLPSVPSSEGIAIRDGGDKLLPRRLPVIMSSAPSFVCHIPTSAGHNIQCLPLPSSISRRSSCILLDGPIDTIITALCDLIGVATDVADMSTASLTAQPEVCADDWLTFWPSLEDLDSRPWLYEAFRQKAPKVLGGSTRDLRYLFKLSTSTFTLAPDKFPDVFYKGNLMFLESTVMVTPLQIQSQRVVTSFLLGLLLSLFSPFLTDGSGRNQRAQHFCHYLFNRGPVKCYFRSLLQAFSVAVIVSGRSDPVRRIVEVLSTMPHTW